MGNCLITRLGGAVSNNSFEVIGSVTVIVDKWQPAVIPSLSVRTSQDCLIILPEGEYFTENDGITPKDNIRSNTFLLQPNSSATTLYFSYVHGDKYAVRITNAEKLLVLKPSSTNKNILVDSNTIRYNYCTNLTTLGDGNFLHISATEDSHIEDLFSSTSLTGVNISGNNSSSPVLGNIEDCVRKLWDKGKRTGTVTVSLGVNNALSFNSVRFSSGYPSQDITIQFKFYDARADVLRNNNVIGSYNGSTWTY